MLARGARGLQDLRRRDAAQRVHREADARHPGGARALRRGRVGRAAAGGSGVQPRGTRRGVRRRRHGWIDPGDDDRRLHARAVVPGRHQRRLLAIGLDDGHGHRELQHPLLRLRQLGGTDLHLLHRLQRLQDGGRRLRSRRVQPGGQQRRRQQHVQAGDDHEADRVAVGATLRQGEVHAESSRIGQWDAAPGTARHAHSCSCRRPGTRVSSR